MEEASLRLLDHGLEILSRLRSRIFLRLMNHTYAPMDDCIPLFVYNYQPYAVDGVFTCEFQPANQNWDKTFTSYTVIADDGTTILSQVEHEASSIAIDWRKKVVFSTELPPHSLTRLRCYPIALPQAPKKEVRETRGVIRIVGEHMNVVINTQTGWVDSIRRDGKEFVKPNAFSLVVVPDNEDPWYSDHVAFPQHIGEFSLMSPVDAASFSGLPYSGLPAVRVIEDGPVRVVVEALFFYGRSHGIVSYFIPKQGYSFDISVTLFWMEANHMAKLCIPMVGEDCRAVGQVVFGSEPFPSNGREAVTQKWQSVYTAKNETTLTIIDNGLYGSDFQDGVLRVSLVRSPVYSALPIGNRPVVSADRHHPRIDMGMRTYNLCILACVSAEETSSIERKALAFNERPYVLSGFPTYGTENRNLPPFLSMSNPHIICTALKRAGTDAPDCEDIRYIIRLHNTNGHRQSTEITCSLVGLQIACDFEAYQIKTFAFTKDGAFEEVSLLEQPL